MTWKKRCITIALSSALLALVLTAADKRQHPPYRKIPHPIPMTA